MFFKHIIDLKLNQLTVLYFFKAAMLFCEAGDHKKGKEMLLKACECYKKKRIWYSAAKTLDQAVILAQEEVYYNVMFKT